LPQTPGAIGACHMAMLDMRLLDHAAGVLFRNGKSRGGVPWQGMVSPQTPGTTDAWRMALLDVLLLDHAFSSSQALAVSQAFTYGHERAAALRRLRGPDTTVGIRQRSEQNAVPPGGELDSSAVLAPQDSHLGPAAN